MSRSTVRIPFVKAGACGNDFLLIAARDVEAVIPPQQLQEFTRRICDRHVGVGADGVEWIYPHDSADAEIRLINADGSQAEISGNGTRCVAAYLCQSSGKETIALATGAGLKMCTLLQNQEPEYEFETEMGGAAVGPEVTVKLKQGAARGIQVSMGNPHFVEFVPDFPPEWQARAAEIQRDSVFLQGVNVEIVRIDGLHDISVRFFERGAGETQSSGTGSCASAAASVHAGLALFPVNVHAAGGAQTVSERDERTFLRGTARLICRGEFFLQ